MSNVYSFTTKLDDNYLTRVLLEAPKNSNIIAIHEILTVPVEGERDANFYVLVKEDYLNTVADKYPDHVFLKHELGAVVLSGMTSGQRVPGYYTFEKSDVPVSEQYEAEAFIFSEVSRLKNLATDRIVKVSVATL